LKGGNISSKGEKWGKYFYFYKIAGALKGGKGELFLELLK
jgi:hypothetical protein